jgi:hypothetical protein
MYQLASGKELTVGRENHTGLLEFILDEEGGKLPTILSGKFTAHKFLDEAYQQYRAKTPDLRTAHPLNETAFDRDSLDRMNSEVGPAEKKERPVLKYKKPKAPKKDS